MKSLLLLTAYTVVNLFLSAYLHSTPRQWKESIYFTNTAGVYKFYADNPAPFPRHLLLWVSNVTNLSPDIELPAIVTLKPGVKKQPLFTLTPVSNGGRWFNYHYRAYGGDPYTPLGAFVYPFPYAHGTKFPAGQGRAHKDSGTNAWDFSMPVGTPLYAVREGWVLNVKEDSDRQGTTPEYGKDGNTVAIVHDDASVMWYVHLKQYGAVVEEGQKVTQGQLIGYSGHTGYSFGPHLHFHLWHPGMTNSGDYAPIPFRSVDGSAVYLEEGRYYYASWPGRPAFKVILGENLEHKALAQMTNRVPFSGKGEITNYRIDSTVAVFARNGTKDALIYTFTLSDKSSNAWMSADSPVTLNVPALSEVFICLLRPADHRKPWSYYYNYRLSRP